MSILTPPISPPPGTQTNVLLPCDTPNPLGTPIASRPRRRPGKILILCFDGTIIRFGENSNVVLFFRALKKDARKDQVVYYQPGIGTYNSSSWVRHTMNMISAWTDHAIGGYIDDQVKDGYTFLIQNYQQGDKICLFGFSIGAYAARVVAGMVYKVGLLPKENLQQVNFAFNIYMTTGYEGYKLCREFKSTFGSSVDIDFVGVWDAPVRTAIFQSYMHPYMSVNYGVKHFRHALAIDERRSIFRPNMWSELTVEREQELDVDLPAPRDDPSTQRDGWKYRAPQRDHADIKEVWFAGCHSDIGAHPTRRTHSLSSIPLRWMIKECILAKTGIRFDMDYLRDALDFDFHNLKAEMKKKNMEINDLGEAYQGIQRYCMESKTKQAEARARSDFQLTDGNYHIHDVFATIFDQLLIIWLWWILEFLPTLTAYQDPQGNWIRLRMCNFGRGRYIPFYKNQILVHETVKLRMEAEKSTYKPNAWNWDTVKDSPMLKYVS